MPSDPSDQPDGEIQTTLDAQRLGLDGPPPQVTALTVLFHPDPHRIGELARLPEVMADRTAAISRTEPVFTAPGALEGAPLADLYVSRTPLHLRRAGLGFELAAARDNLAVVNGVPLAGRRTLSEAELRAGVVLELSKRVVLLLHFAGPARRPLPALGLVGLSDAMERLRAEILRVAALELPVLIRGETGAGKELVARAIWTQSRRAARPFVPVNMSTLPATTAASELFGHVAGAFTGAAQAHGGMFGDADGGTLFLDEVAETPADVQPMLLRALESGEVRPVGAPRPSRVEVRVISATDARLEERIETGAFREPLYHRLAGYELRVPPLRDRLEDLGRLILHFHLQDPVPGAAITAELVAALALRKYPGNVRELHNALRQALLSGAPPPPRSTAPHAPIPASPVAPQAPATELTEATLIDALRAASWRTSVAARALGISRTTLYALLEKSPQLRKAKDIPEAELVEAREACGGDVNRMAERLRVSPHGLKLRLKDLRR